MRKTATFQVLRETIERRLTEQAEARATRTEPALTITRSTGSGAFSVAEQLARRLEQQDDKLRPWTVVDRDLVRRVIEDHHLPERLERFFPEDRVPMVDALLGELLGAHPPLDTVVRKTTETVRGLCQMGRVIIVGRGANIMAAGMPNVRHIRLVGAVESRIARVIRELEMGPKEARTYVEETDAARAAYVRQHFGLSINDPLLYHLVINTDRFADEEVVRLIERTLHQQEPKRARVRSSSHAALG